MEYDPAGGSCVVSLDDVDGFIAKLQSQHHPEPATEAYHQVSDPELERYIDQLEYDQNVSDSNPERIDVGNSSFPMRYINSQKKYSIVGKGKGTVKDNPLYSDKHTYNHYEPTYDALSVGPPPARPVRKPKGPRLKLMYTIPNQSYTKG